MSKSLALSLCSQLISAKGIHVKLFINKCYILCLHTHHYDFSYGTWVTQLLVCLGCSVTLVSFSCRLLAWLEDLEVIYHGMRSMSVTEPLCFVWGWGYFHFHAKKCFMHCLVLNKIAENVKPDHWVLKINEQCGIIPMKVWHEPQNLLPYAVLLASLRFWCQIWPFNNFSWTFNFNSFASSTYIPPLGIWGCEIPDCHNW